MKVSTFLLLAALVSIAYCQNCTSFDTCKTCTANNACGWCGPTATCSAGSATGPNTGKCYGSSWFYNFGNVPNPCPNCTSLTNCKSCLYHNADCMWCGSSSTCREWGTWVGCSQVDQCPCNVYDTCSDCLTDNGCFWCASGNATCMNSGATCAMPSHTCPCGDNTDCSSCLDDSDAGCVWCDQPGGVGICQQPNANGSSCAAALNCQAFCSSQGQTCDSCNDLVGCGWCENTQSCVDASAGVCSGPLLHACPNCGMHKYCDPCQDEGCIWCASGECRPPGDTANCLVEYTCNQYCSLFTDCTNCNKADGCGWCEGEKGGCTDSDSATCLLVHTCSDSGEGKCGFDGGAFVGGMFLGLGLCAIGIGGFLFYRFKMNRKPGYSELH